MDDRTSGTKKLTCLNGSTIPCKRPSRMQRLATRGYRIDLHRRFARFRWGKPDGGESCIVLESGPTRSLVAKPPRLAVCKFRNCNWGMPRTSGGHGRVRAKLCCRMSWGWSASEWSQLCTWAQLTHFRSTTQEFSMVGGYMEDIEKPQNCNVGACSGVGACPVNTLFTTPSKYFCPGYVIIIIIILMTREAGVAYKSIKYELCNLKAKCTNLAKEFTTAVFLDVNRRINLSLVERYMKLGWNLTMIVYSSSLRSLYTGQTHTKWTSSSIQLHDLQSLCSGGMEHGLWYLPS